MTNPTPIDPRPLSRRMRDILRRDKTATRPGKCRILKDVRMLERAQVLIKDLAKQIRPTTRPSARAYAAQRAVEEWTGREIGDEVCADDGERLHLIGRESALTI